MTSRLKNRATRDSPFQSFGSIKSETGVGTIQSSYNLMSRATFSPKLSFAEFALYCLMLAEFVEKLILDK